MNLIRKLVEMMTCAIQIGVIVTTRHLILFYYSLMYSIEAQRADVLFVGANCSKFVFYMKGIITVFFFFWGLEVPGKMIANSLTAAFGFVTALAWFSLFQHFLVGG